jgi:hypothetical protein
MSITGTVTRASGHSFALRLILSSLGSARSRSDLTGHDEPRLAWTRRGWTWQASQAKAAIESLSVAANFYAPTPLRNFDDAVQSTTFICRLRALKNNAIPVHRYREFDSLAVAVHGLLEKSSPKPNFQPISAHRQHLHKQA